MNYRKENEEGPMIDEQSGEHHHYKQNGG